MRTFSNESKIVLSSKQLVQSEKKIVFPNGET